MKKLILVGLSATLPLATPLCAGDRFDFSTRDQSHVVWGSSEEGMRLWNVDANEPAGFLGKVNDQTWSNSPLEWIPGTSRVIYGTAAGIRVWDALTNTDLGHYNNVTTGNWKEGLDIALHPEDSSLILWTSSTGIRVWNTETNENLGVFHAADGDWSGYGIANHPTNPNYILYPAPDGRINIWDTVLNLLVGPFGRDEDAGWTRTHIISSAPVREILPTFPLSIRREGNQVFLSWPAEVGASYQLQSGTRLWDFKDKGASFVATADPMEATFAATAPTEFFRVCKLSGPPADLAPSADDFATAVVGKTLSDTDYFMTSAARFTWNGEAGNWTYTKTGANTALLVFTYDEDGNNPSAYREEVSLTFTGEGTGTYDYAEYEFNTLSSVVEGVPFSLN